MHEDDRVDTRVVIGLECDGIVIMVGDKRWRIDHEFAGDEQCGEDLVDLFRHLGFDNVKWEEWY